MKLSGLTFAVLASLLSSQLLPAFSAETAASKSESFKDAKHVTPATNRAAVPTPVQPHASPVPLFAKRPAPGVRRAAPIAVTEAHPKSIITFSAAQPSGRAVSIVSPSTQGPVRFWHRGGGVASPTGAQISTRTMAPTVYRPGHAPVTSSVAPAGLNRFISPHHTNPTTPARPGAAPMDSR